MTHALLWHELAVCAVTGAKLTPLQWGQRAALAGEATQMCPYRKMIHGGSEAEYEARQEWLKGWRSATQAPMPIEHAIDIIEF